MVVGELRDASQGGSDSFAMVASGFFFVDMDDPLAVRVGAKASGPKAAAAEVTDRQEERISKKL